jgi:hypothetical protein
MSAKQQVFARPAGGGLGRPGGTYTPAIRGRGMSEFSTEETINWAAGISAYWGKAAVPLGGQIVSR